MKPHLPATAACPNSGPEKLGRKSHEFFHDHCPGDSWGETSSFSTQTSPSGAATRPTEQTCGMKHHQKHPRHPSASLAFLCPSRTAGLAGLWECRGGTNLCGSYLNWGTQLLLETGANTPVVVTLP